MFADASHPIRCSKLGAVAKCTARIHMIELLTLGGTEESEGGEAAQTGSLTHAGVAEFHRAKGNLDERQKAGWDAIAKASPLFPLADPTEVRLFFTPYINDPRNIHAEFARLPNGELAIEQEINFTIPPHPLDITKQPIHLQGHYDQIRIRQNRMMVDDLKTGKISGWQMQHDYAIQLAAYTYGIRATQFPNCEVGKIIRAHGYRTRSAIGDSPDGVFWENLFDVSQLETVLEVAQLAVAVMRMGHVTFGTGPHCTYCEFGGLLHCQRKWKELQT